ncbi:tripeptidyl peptidase A [Dentipellis sp. KUC8613]|nr:tripeptidyl peptidase A [Dentipellis sp. KUC8613]
MLPRLIPTALLALSALAAAAPNSTPKLKERITAPRNWEPVKRAPPAHVLTLRIALPQPNFSVLEQHLWEVSDPDHARYGEHLSKAEVEALLAPHEDSVSAVESWLAEHGVPAGARTHSPAGDWVKISVPVALAEKMLNTEYHVWKHTADGTTVLRTTHYSLPEALHPHVELIQPTTIFARTNSHRTTFHSSTPAPDSAPAPGSAAIFDTQSGIRVDASCNTTITVDCLKQIYNFADYKPQVPDKNSFGITAYIGQFANEVDLNDFYADQVPQAVNSTFQTILVNGGQNNQSAAAAGPEANLDTQFGYGLTFPTPGVFWSTGGEPPFDPDTFEPTNTNEPYADWADFVLAQHDLPQTISTSYGDDEQTVPESYAKRVCASFAALGARGVTLTFSSGDFGVGDGNPNPANQSCFALENGKNVTKFLPAFPASCPYVTAVGGTIGIPEVAVNFSGGGFSNYFSRPSYQDAAVESFLAKLPKDTYSGLFNPHGRAYPDISAQADHFRIFFQGKSHPIGGTSASGPTVAALVSLLNDARIAAHLPPLGFLNPLLYARGVAGLRDVTSGNNPGCGTPGFNATEGWDPVTGLGTPDFGKLKNIVLGH